MFGGKAAGRAHGLLFQPGPGWAGAAQAAQLFGVGLSELVALRGVGGLAQPAADQGCRHWLGLVEPGVLNLAAQPRAAGITVGRDQWQGLGKTPLLHQGLGQQVLGSAACRIKVLQHVAGGGFGLAGLALAHGCVPLGQVGVTAEAAPTAVKRTPGQAHQPQG